MALIAVPMILARWFFFFPIVKRASPTTRNDDCRWLTHTMTLLYMWHDSFIWVTWLIHMCDMTHSVWSRGFHSGRRGKHHHMWQICDVTHSYVWCDSFICVSWFTKFCPAVFIAGDKGDTIICNKYVTWLTHVWLDSCICVMTHPFLSCSFHSGQGGRRYCMGWLRLVGS